MTKLPMETWEITPLKGEMYPDFKVGPLCSVPGCSRFSDHAHHIWRRSFLAGAYSWVKLPDETIVGNLTGLCWQHHNAVTEDMARIRLEKMGDGYCFFWESGVDLVLKPLNPQPPIRGQVARELGTKRLDAEGQCPSCKRPLPRPKIDTPPEERRPRKTWTITVPADKREDGAEVLDVLLESARLMLEQAGIVYGEQRGLRYFVLATVLGLFNQHGESFLADS